MLEFIQLLKHRYQTVLAQQSIATDKTLYQQRIDKLILAEAFMRKGQAVNQRNSLPLQIAVIGPTQVGKSSVVNVLLETGAAAGVSPLAGYTVHPQGFCHRLDIADCAGLQHYFGRFQCLPQEQLSKQRLDCYALQNTTAESALLPECVLWDTPDFDSIDSDTYREGVIRTLALADIIVLVVSKEKYADQTVWEMMAMLASLQQPTLICLNKLPEGAEALLLPSLQEKWQQVRDDAFPDVIPLYYQKPIGLPIWPEAKKSSLLKLVSKISAKNHPRIEQQLLQKYWPDWLQPIKAEHQSFAEWEAMVSKSMQESLASYQRDFLNHPHHYETFQQAMAELLTLLEIPGLAGFLTGARKAMTWPVRQLMKFGRKQLHLTETSHEIVLLKQIAEHSLIHLAEALLDKSSQGEQALWWKELSQQLRNQRSQLLLDFADSAKNYHLGFQQDVEQTAHSLYYKLQEQPLVLNSLRATRVTADAAVIALTLHTGGIGVHDLVIAPAMLTVTSLLTESAIGSYMQKLESQLKKHQLQAVKQQLFVDGINTKLLSLPAQLSALSHFNITPSQLSTAEQQLKEKRHGLRLL
jgi:GTPase SAR1 family protein